MKTVFDSSSFAKRYVAETGSNTVDELCQNTSELGLCVLCVPEIISALNRRRREGHLPQPGYEQAKAQLAADAVLTRLNQATAVRYSHNSLQFRSSQAVSARCSIGSQAWIHRSLMPPRQYSTAI